MKKNIFIFSILSVIFSSLYAKDDTDYHSLALELKETHPTSDCIILSTATNVRFYYDKFSKKVYAEEYTEQKILALKANTVYHENVYYDDYSSITSSLLQDEKRRKMNFVPVCGSYEQNGIFHSDTKFCSYSLKFSHVGEVKYLSIKRKITDLKYLPNIYFHTHEDVEEARIEIVIPNWLTLSTQDFNFELFDIEHTEKEGKDSKTISYVAKHLSKFKEEKYAADTPYNYPHIFMMCQAIALEHEQSLISDVNSLYQWYRSLLLQVDNKDAEVEKKAKELTAGLSSDEEKVKVIFDWVQNKIRYIAFEDGISGFRPKSAKNVFKNKYGDCKGMSNLMKSMLAAVGIDARMTWLGTNHLPYDYSIPSLSINNHAICTVYLGDKKYFCDPTEKYIALNDYAERIQGKQVMIENGETYTLDSVPMLDYKRNLSHTHASLTIKGENLVGKLQQAYTGESRNQFFYYFATIDKTKHEELIQKIISNDDNNVKIETMTHSDFFNKEDTLTIKAEVQIANRVAAFDNEIYIDFDLNKELSDFEIEKDRTNDVDFDEKLFFTNTTVFDLATGIKVSHLPTPIDIENDLLTIKVDLIHKGDKLYYDKRIILKKQRYSKEEFETLTNSIQKLKDFYNDQIILLKS